MYLKFYRLSRLRGQGPLIELSDFKIVDLSHPITSDMPNWPGDPKTRIVQMAKISQQGFNLAKLIIGEHSGTHIGVPRHFVQEGKDTSQLSLDHLILPLIKIDRSKEAIEPDYVLSLHEARQITHDLTIPKNSVVVVETGWDNFWYDSDRYFGKKGKSMHFPGISLQAARFFIKEKRVAGLGIDTAGIDGGQSKNYETNKYLARTGRFHLENLTNLHQIPSTGSLLFIGVLPIINGSGSPCRAIALTPK